MLYTVSATKNGGTVKHVYCEAEAAWRYVQDFKRNSFRNIQIIDQTERSVTETELQARAGGAELRMR